MVPIKIAAAVQELPTPELLARAFPRVLLIEDDEGHSVLLKRALRNAVGDILWVNSGSEGLKRITPSTCSLVLCDLNLQDCSGLEVTEAIHREYPQLPVIMLTSSSNLDDAVSAMRAGAWDYLVKQFTSGFTERLHLVLHRVWDQLQRQERELLLRAERDAFWSAAYTAPDGLAIVKPDGDVQFANPAFERFCTNLGGSSGENVIRQIEKHDESVAKTLLDVLHGSVGGALWSAEILPKSAGTDVQKAYEISVGVVHRESDEAAASDSPHAVLWVRDISRRKEQEKFQRDLLSTTTHDLKGPLGAVLTCSELLSESDGVQGRDRDLVTRIASCARNSISIIDELLSARRIQDGVMVVRPQNLDVSQILEDIVLDYEPVARAKDIEFSFRSVPGMTIYADRIALIRVLGNLVSNALKFSSKGGKVEMFAERVGHGTRIAVSDSGPGIEASARHRLFERFGRLDKHQHIEGTGLGLFVTKNILDAHDGTIEIRSKVGVGSTFLVTFPDEAQGTDQAKARDADSATNGTEQRSSSETS